MQDGLFSEFEDISCPAVKLQKNPKQYLQIHILNEGEGVYAILLIIN